MLFLAPRERKTVQAFPIQDGDIPKKQKKKEKKEKKEALKLKKIKVDPNEPEAPSKPALLPDYSEGEIRALVALLLRRGSLSGPLAPQGGVHLLRLREIQREGKLTCHPEAVRPCVLLAACMLTLLYLGDSAARS